MRILSAVVASLPAAACSSPGPGGTSSSLQTLPLPPPSCSRVVAGCRTLFLGGVAPTTAQVCHTGCHLGLFWVSSDPRHEAHISSTQIQLLPSGPPVDAGGERAPAERPHTGRGCHTHGPEPESSDGRCAGATLAAAELSSPWLLPLSLPLPHRAERHSIQSVTQRRPGGTGRARDGLWQTYPGAADIPTHRASSGGWLAGSHTGWGPSRVGGARCSRRGGQPVRAPAGGATQTRPTLWHASVPRRGGPLLFGRVVGGVRRKADSAGGVGTSIPHRTHAFVRRFSAGFGTTSRLGGLALPAPEGRDENQSWDPLVHPGLSPAYLSVGRGEPTERTTQASASHSPQVHHPFSGRPALPQPAYSCPQPSTTVLARPRRARDNR